jgi:hypothetical protein
MPTSVQFRRGTTAQHGSFTGAVGEITVDTDKDTAVVHDGSTAGGYPLLKEASVGTTVQSYDADLAAIAALSTTGLINRTGAGTAATVTVPSGDLVGTSATQTLTNKTLTSPELTSAPYVNGSYRGNIVAVGALDIDCSAGNYFTKTISGASTFTVSNVPSSRSYSFTLELTHTSGAITWFSGVEWPKATAPTLTTGKTHLFMFVTDDGGTRWRASALVDYTN